MKIILNTDRDRAGSAVPTSFAVNKAYSIQLLAKAIWQALSE
ncbi:hypothetical protein ACFIOY_09485 [Bradyrhizobium sp. TZ2]